MKKYLFVDKATGEEFVIQSVSVSEAIMESLMQALEGIRVRPFFVREIEV